MFELCWDEVVVGRFNLRFGPSVGVALLHPFWTICWSWAFFGDVKSTFWWCKFLHHRFGAPKYTSSIGDALSIIFATTTKWISWKLFWVIRSILKSFQGSWEIFCGALQHTPHIWWRNFSFSDKKCIFYLFVWNIVSMIGRFVWISWYEPEYQQV